LQRSKRIVLLSHCLLNVNSKVYGLANYPGVYGDLIRVLIDEDLGIIQLPCPEMLMGIRRWGHVREQLAAPFFMKHCSEIFAPILQQILDYHNNGYHFAGLIGIDGSPSCGVHTTCSSSTCGGEISCRASEAAMNDEVKMIKAPGVFIEHIQNILAANNVIIPMFAIEEADPAASIAEVIKFVKGEV